MENQKLAREKVEVMLKEALSYYRERGFKILHGSRPEGEKHPFFNIDYKKKELKIFANKQDHTEVLRYRLITFMLKESFPPKLRKRFASKKS